jgi:predicted extracellular nuclease
MSATRIINPFILITLVLCSSKIFAQELTAISAIQGTKEISPIVGKQVTLEGIVTADFQDQKSFSGFYIQSQSVNSKLLGSSGIFVYENRKNVNIGDLIRLTGEVSEHNEVTQIAKIKSIEILKKNQKLPQAVAIDLPLNGLNFENLEGMRVTLKQPALITDHYNYIRFGEITVSSQILMTPTNSVPT